jgi:hypothetical protein
MLGVTPRFIARSIFWLVASSFMVYSIGRVVKPTLQEKSVVQPYVVLYH